MPQEIELKLRLSSNDVPEIIGCLNRNATPTGTSQLNNDYFDTPALDLAKAKAALRIRTGSQGSEQTLKTRGKSQAGMQIRNEWNWPLTSNQLNVDLLQSKEVAAFWPQEASIHELECLFHTNFQRQKWIYEKGSNRIEVVIDQGHILANNKSQNLCELELELQKGTPESLWNLLQDIYLTKASLWLSDVSKAERGYRLAGIDTGWQNKIDKTIEQTNTSENNLNQLQRALEKSVWENADPSTSIKLISEWKKHTRNPIKHCLCQLQNSVIEHDLTSASRRLTELSRLHFEAAK